MARPTITVKVPAIGQPYTMVAGPPNSRPVPYNVVMPVRTDTMEKDTEKLDNNLHDTSRVSSKERICRKIHLKNNKIAYARKKHKK
jgi:hypothetical protein